MRHIYFTSLLLIISSLPASISAQELSLILEPGIGSYRMTELKELNRYNLSSLPFDAKQTDNYPSYWIYKSSLLLSVNRLFSVGVTFSNESTGSRISRADYSGEYRFDTKVRAFSPGAIVEIRMPVNKFNISLSNETGIEFSKLRVTELFRLYTESEETPYTFSSKNFYYEPIIKISYPVCMFRWGIYAGYLFDLKKEELHGSDANIKSITLPVGGKAECEWSGLRIGTSLSYNILRTFKTRDQRSSL